MANDPLTIPQIVTLPPKATPLTARIRQLGHTSIIPEAVTLELCREYEELSHLLTEIVSFIPPKLPDGVDYSLNAKASCFDHAQDLLAKRFGAPK